MNRVNSRNGLSMMTAPQTLSLLLFFFVFFVFFWPWYFIPKVRNIKQVWNVWNGYDGDSKIEKVDRQTALKHWIAVEMRWYRNVVSRGSAVHCDALLPISVMNSWASSGFALNRSASFSGRGVSLIVYKSSAVVEMGDRLATIDMGRKVGAAVSLSVGALGPHLTQCRLGRAYTSIPNDILIHLTVWPLLAVSESITEVVQLSISYCC